MSQGNQERWLLLIHQIPPKPNYFRVKIGRRLHRLGAVAIKNSVYVLPKSDQTQEDFQWVRREIVEGGGEATLCEARFIDGLTDDQVQASFQTARDADYAEIAEDAKALLKTLTESQADKERPPHAETEFARLKRRLAEVVAIDFFGAPGREIVEGVLQGIEGRLRITKPSHLAVSDELSDLRERTWVTRKGVQTDRMASAWLIRRFIDPEAQFKFVPAKGYQPQPGELRFDMFEAEYTHEGDNCTFEVMLDRLGLDDPALRAIAEIIHDIDLKDEKFSRPEAIGLERLISGIALAHPADEARLSRSGDVFDDLHTYFKGQLAAKSAKL